MTPTPLFHFTPPQHWINDPNGLVYFDGEWHLFYQHNPFGIEWGHMSWGHAVSHDLAHWEHLPVALPEQPGYMIFSGSAAVDWNNTSGFGDGIRPPLVAAYTAHSPHEQTQHIAFSLDRGRTWTPYVGNPVIAIGSREFRDPRLFWHAPSRHWVMACVLADQHQVRFYGSPNLRNWQHLSDFGPAGAADGLWECPDFFPLRVEEDGEVFASAAATDLDSRPLIPWSLAQPRAEGSRDLRGNDGVGREKWILKVDDQRLGAQYFVGDFDGERFVCDDRPARVRPLDYGADFYAAQSWSDAPDDRRVWLAWMSHWDYAAQTPTAPWRGMMTIPRELMLKSFADGLHLVQQPAVELKQLRGAQHHIADVSVAEANAWLESEGVRGTALEIAVEFVTPLRWGGAGVCVRAGAAEETLIGCDATAREAFVDRGRAGDNSFSPRFDDRHTAHVDLDGGRVRLHIFVDACSVEVFVNDGRIALSELIFPEDASDGLALFGDGDVRVQSLDVWKLQK